MQRIGLVGLCKIELPTGNVCLCDGGKIAFGGDSYRAKHPVFGVIGRIEPLGEGVGNEVPALQMMLLPANAATPDQLVQPGFQRSRVRMWLGEYDLETHTLSGTPDLLFDGQLDQCSLEIDGDQRTLAIGVVSTAERLFERNAGNSLSPAFHKSVWPGELGHDNATGIGLPVAWGTEQPTAPTAPPPGGGRR